MNLAESKLRRLDDPLLTSEQRASLRCRVAAEFIHTGQYEAAIEALGEFWCGVGVRPDLKGLQDTIAAEVLLQCGALSSSLGISKQTRRAQDAAKDLISEALRLFDTRGLYKRVAEAQCELGVCYWRAGALDDARVMLQDAANKLGEADTEQKAKVLIRSSCVEVSAGRYNDALRILKEAEPVFKIASDALKGRWHGQKALVLRRLGTAEGRSDYLDSAIIEYTAAIVHYEQARHERYCATNENNLAFLLCKISRYQEAHKHLDHALRVLKRLGDTVLLAQVQETRARVLLAEHRNDEAARIIKSAVETLEQSGELALLADAMVVQATIQARRGNYERSLPTFRQAINIAEDAGALESAGNAALALIEEHGIKRISENELYNLYFRADELLTSTQDPESIARLRACARILGRRLSGKLYTGFSLPDAIHAYEAWFIERALTASKGSVTHAARSLGISHQRLANLLETRHNNLFKARTPPTPRKRSIIKQS